MLDSDYPTQFGDLIQSVRWDIELPMQWQDFFEQRGEVPSYVDDDRSSQRLKVRTHGIAWVERSLPFRSRSTEPIGVYTRDFSRNGTGFLSSFEIFPEENIRIVLPTFWCRLHVRRARRITSKCYEIGAALVSRHDPSLEAFEPVCPAMV
ncbi:hypothetical protein LF1_32110 [Rubripirellula obstinata]|uniref:PilZ domain-containing protein n=1 Tax=Rubripirellula obstinata TaxID=406547 RepID=A0A5B1CK47_9BACT|nr:hypothetical protein [Rubripirellula obstinata]KAA1260671.1 hypothetical protein LF1_32110 [Rubripirellula obstinata]